MRPISEMRESYTYKSRDLKYLAKLTDNPWVFYFKWFSNKRAQMKISEINKLEKKAILESIGIDAFGDIPISEVLQHIMQDIRV